MHDHPPTLSATYPRALRDLAERQDYVLSRAQLSSLGITDSEAAAHLRALRWRAIGHVVVLHRGPRSRPQRWWCATLNAGRTAMLGGLTALEAAGLKGWTRPATHLLTAKSTDAPVHEPDVTVHETRRLPRPVRVKGPPRTTVARAAVDAAAWSLDRRGAAGLLMAVVQQRLTTPDALETELRGRARVRHGTVLRPLIDDLRGGAHSLAELDLAPLLRAAGLPAPRRQVVLRDSTGRRRYLDVQTVLPDGTPLVIEVDGAHHLDPVTQWADQRRQNEVVLAGRRVVLHFAAFAVRHEPQEVIDQLVRARRTHTPSIG